MGKIAFVFSGQGAQYSGMGRTLFDQSPAAKELFTLADAIRPGTSEQCFTGSGEALAETKNTQPCLFCVDMAAALALREAGIVPHMVAGFSLGELAALCFSGAIGPADCFDLVCRRGALMQQAAQQSDSAMAAVLKLPNHTVEDLCNRYEQVYPVNYNCPGQLVVAGRRTELDLFRADVKATGGRALPLPVGGGFHSPFMAQAAEGFKAVLETIPLTAPEIPVYSNVSARPYGDAVAPLLVRQTYSPVRWQETIEHMIADGADTFIEAGPGKTLCGLIAKINPAVRVLNVDTADDLEKTVLEVNKHA